MAHSDPRGGSATTTARGSGVRTVWALRASSGESSSRAPYRPRHDSRCVSERGPRVCRVRRRGVGRGKPVEEHDREQREPAGGENIRICKTSSDWWQARAPVRGAGGYSLSIAGRKRQRTGEIDTSRVDEQQNGDEGDEGGRGLGMADGADEVGAFAVGRLVGPKWAPWTEKETTKSTTACARTKCRGTNGWLVSLVLRRGSLPHTRLEESQGWRMPRQVPK